MGSSKINNRQRVLKVLRNNLEMSISDISDAVGASKPTIKKALDFYIESGLVTEAGKGDSGDEGGKRPGLYRFNPEYGYFIGVHLGPGFINAALINLDHEIIKSSYVEVETLDADEFVDNIIAMVESFLCSDDDEQCRVFSLTVGMPGMVDEQKGESIFTPHFPDWPMRYPIRENLNKKLPVKLPIYVDCINRYQALAEMMCGVAEGKKNFMIVDALSEGIGAGIVVNGSIRHGSQSFSGEIGHIVLDSLSNEGCICGGKGCFEALVSERRVQKLIVEGVKNNPDSSLAAGIQDTGFVQLFDSFAAGDELAEEIIDDLVFWFASGLNNIIMINDPELIVIQGIFINAGAVFLEKLQQSIRDKVYTNLERCVDIRYSSLGAERGVLGCGVFGGIQFFENKKLYTGDKLILE